MEQQRNNIRSKKFFRVLTLCALAEGSLFSMNEAMAQKDPSPPPPTCTTSCRILKDYCMENNNLMDFDTIINYCINDVNTYTKNTHIDCSALQNKLLSSFEAPLAFLKEACTQVENTCKTYCTPISQ
jgi:hypothetical protein